MAHTESAKKNYRKMLKRRARNIATASRFKTEMKRVLAAVGEKDAAKAAKLLPDAVSAIDKAAKLGVIHKNTAANKKSVLARSVGRLTKPA